MAARFRCAVTAAYTFALAAAAVQPAPAQLVRYEYAELHMGMRVRMVLYARSDGIARDAARAAFDRMAALEDILSDYRPGSELRRLGRVGAGQRIPLSPPLCEVLERALEVARATGGAFDPTVGPYVALWREARVTRRLPSDSALANARRRAGWHHVTLGADCAATFAVARMQLDLGGIAKGYVLDRALAVLDSLGLSRALLEAGGDVVVGDAPPGREGWHVATPHADSALAARASRIARAAIATSGDAEQFVEIGGVRYSHIVDPRTGLGATGARRAIVIARDGATADAWATALALRGSALPAPPARDSIFATVTGGGSGGLGNCDIRCPDTP